MGRTISRLFIIIIAQAVVLSACDSCKRPDKGNTNANLEQTSNKIELLKTDTLVVNVYVDKTGDMQGYFKDKSDIRDIIERYLKEIGKIDTNKPYKAIRSTIASICAFLPSFNSIYGDNPISQQRLRNSSRVGIVVPAKESSFHKPKSYCFN